MAAKKLTITEGLDLAADDSITRADFVYWFTQALFGDVDRDHFASGTSPVVSSASAPSAPATGLGWHDTASGAVSFWDGSAWITSVFISATAPGSTGVPWYDTSIGTLRVYVTLDGIVGWHSTDPAFQLMTNRSGSTVEVNNVVIRDTTGTTAREFTTGIIVKDQGVVGVLMEEATVGGDGLVAMVGGGAVVNVLADDAAADGAIVMGDGLVHYSVKGECRTVGQLPGNWINSTAIDFEETHGTPMGCFAEALGPKDATTHLVRARLLGSVGSGADIWFHAVEDSITDYSVVGTSTDYDETANLKSAKHGPLVGVYRSWRAGITTGTGLYDCELFMRRGDDSFASNADQVLVIEGHNGTGSIVSGCLARTFLRTSAGTGAYGDPGNIWVYKRVETARTFGSIQSKLTGYRY